jgi:hypothetical protein
MINTTRSTKSLLVFGSIALTIGVCVLVFAYLIGIEIDKTSCYNRLAKSLNVVSTYEAINSAVSNQVQAILQPGINRDMAITKLSEIAPIIVDGKWSRMDGDIAEEVTLKTCFFHQNDLTFLIEYSKDEILKSVKRYVDD